MSNTAQAMSLLPEITRIGGAVPPAARSTVSGNSGMFAALLHGLLNESGRHDGLGLPSETESVAVGYAVLCCPLSRSVGDVLAEENPERLFADAAVGLEGCAAVGGLTGIEPGTEREHPAVTDIPLIVAPFYDAAGTLQMLDSGAGYPESPGTSPVASDAAIQAEGVLASPRDGHIPPVSHTVHPSGGWVIAAVQQGERGDTAPDAHDSDGTVSGMSREVPQPFNRVAESTQFAQDAVSPGEHAGEDGTRMPIPPFFKHWSTSEPPAVSAQTDDGHTTTVRSPGVPRAQMHTALSQRPDADYRGDTDRVPLTDNHVGAAPQEGGANRGPTRTMGRDVGSCFADVYCSIAACDAHGTARPTVAAVPDGYAGILEQVARPFVAGLQVGSREVVIRLEPEHLGVVRVRLSVANGMVSAKIAVENRQVKQIMEAGMPLLHDTLRAHGLTCEHVDVRVDQLMAHYDHGHSFAEQGRGDSRSFEPQPDLRDGNVSPKHVLPGHHPQSLCVPGTAGLLGVNVLV